MTDAKDIDHALKLARLYAADANTSDNHTMSLALLALSDEVRALRKVGHTAYELEMRDLYGIGRHPTDIMSDLQKALIAWKPWREKK